MVSSKANTKFLTARNSSLLWPKRSFVVVLGVENVPNGTKFVQENKKCAFVVNCCI